MSGDLVLDLLQDPLGLTDTLAEAARQAPAVVDASTGVIYVLRYDEIDTLARDRRMTGVGLTLFDLMGIEGELRDWYSSLMFTNEGETHLRLRRLVSRAFTPKAVDRLRQHAVGLVESSFASLETAGGGDLVAAFRLVPIRVICRLLGVPDEENGVFAGWADALSPIFAYMDKDQIEAARSALAGLLAYVADLVDRRRSSPSDDLITALLEAGESGDRLTRQEVATMVANLLVGGHDTTGSQLACTLLTFLRHPESVTRISSGEVTPADAVTETMRFEPSIGAVARRTTEPVEIAGITRPAGTVIVLALSTGNRDPEIWEDPDSFRVDRFASPTAPHLLSFGTGAHYCLGSNLARMTLEETTRGLVARNVVPAIDLDDVPWRIVLGRSPATLPVCVSKNPVS